MADQRTGKDKLSTGKDILAERARTIALPEMDILEPRTANHTEILCFSLGKEVYAIDIQYITESSHLIELTPVPGTPSFLTGITAIKGKIVPVVNLKTVFHLANQGISPSTTIILLSKEQIDIAVQADAVNGTRWISLPDLLPPPATIHGFGAEHIMGITQDSLIVLDGKQLVQSLHQRIISKDQYTT